MESIYRALSAEAVGGKDPSGGGRSTSASFSRIGSSQSTSADGGDDQPAGLLHATISRYFDQGPAAAVAAVAAASVGSETVSGHAVDKSFSGSSGTKNSTPSSSGDVGGASRDTHNDNGYSLVEQPNPDSTLSSPKNTTVAVNNTDITTTQAPPSGEQEQQLQCQPPARPLPHQALADRACELLVRDASVLVSDPSFRGRLDAGFDDGYGGDGGGLGFFDTSTGRTSGLRGGAGARGGGGGRDGVSGMAAHAWLLKVRCRVLSFVDGPGVLHCEAGSEGSGVYVGVCNLCRCSVVICWRSAIAGLGCVSGVVSAVGVRSTCGHDVLSNETDEDQNMSPGIFFLRIKSSNVEF